MRTYSVRGASWVGGPGCVLSGNGHPDDYHPRDAPRRPHCWNMGQRHRRLGSSDPVREDCLDGRELAILRALRQPSVRVV